MERSPFSNATLRALPARAYAHYTPVTGWTLRRDGATVAEATLSESELIALANDIADENDWRRQSRRGDAERDYNGEE